MNTTRKDAARKKLLNILSRNVLEELSQKSDPWRHDRASLIGASLVNWSQDDVEYEIKKLLRETI
jgi:hypothetical protein